MSLTRFEGTVENGLVRLPDDVSLPDNTKVFVLIPNNDTTDSPKIRSPRLANPSQASDFRKQVIDENPNADV